MSRRCFEDWLDTFRETIYGFDYYVDFEKVYRNVESIEDELNLLNGLVGKKDPEAKFRELMRRYPSIRKALPILFAYRKKELEIFRGGKSLFYRFDGRATSAGTRNTVDDYVLLMREMGLFDLFSEHIIGDVRDYVCGVEVGMDTNARKNRGGHEMEGYIRSAIEDCGFRYSEELKPAQSGVYRDETYLSKLVEAFPDLDLGPLAGGDHADKRFDFVVKTASCVYGVEVNFYAGSGSKLNETARSYKEIAEAARGIDGFKFVWFTDGAGWKSTRGNLKETFAVLDDLYNIAEIEGGVMKRLFV